MSVRPAALFFIILALAACSAPAPHPGPGPAEPTAVLDLGNRSDVACDVYLGRALLATVAPGEWVSLPNLSGSRVKLNARCGGDRFDAEVDLEGDSPRWVVGAAQRAMSTAPARLWLANRTALDFEVYLATGRLGALLAGADRRIGGLPPGPLRVRLVGREGQGSWEFPVEAVSGAWTRLVVDPPRGRLVLQNDSSEPTRIKVGERLERRLSPGEHFVLEDLSPGAWRIEATLVQSRRIVSAALTVTAGADATWAVSRESAALSVRNYTDEPMAIAIRGKAVGLVAPGEELAIRDLTTGVARLTATGQETSIRIEKDETLVPGATHQWELNTGAGLLTLVNAFPEEVEVYLDGVRSLALGAGGEVALSLTAGEHKVGWSSALTNASGRALVGISSAHARRVTLGPGSARVSVTNRLPGPVALYLGSRFQARLPVGESVTLCGLMAGTRLLEAVEETGLRRVHRRTLELDPGGRGTWEILPRTFELVIENSAGEDLRALGDLEALLPEIAAGDTARLDTPVGTFKGVLVGKRTGLLYQNDLEGAEGEEHRWTVPRPVGTLVVTNSAGRDVALFESEREVARIPPGGRATLGDLSPGPHSLRARAEGLLLGQKDFLVRPGSEFLWDLRPAYGRVRIVNRTDSEILLVYEDQPTGRLFAGAETTLKDLPLFPVTLRAVHSVSGAARGIRITPSAESPPTWFIEPDTGQLEVRGLEGHEGELRPDEGAVVRFDGSNDRVFLALSPGWHDVSIVAAEGGFPDVRRVQVYAGQTTAISRDGARFALEVINSLGEALVVEVDDRQVATVPGGGEVLIDDLEAGVRRFRAHRQSGGGASWLLREVTFQGGRTYRWTVPLEPGVAEDPR